MDHAPPLLAVDLGCMYTLRVDESGPAALLHTTLGLGSDSKAAGTRILHSRRLLAAAIYPSKRVPAWPLF